MESSYKLRRSIKEGLIFSPGRSHLRGPLWLFNISWGTWETNLGDGNEEPKGYENYEESHNRHVRGWRKCLCTRQLVRNRTRPLNSTPVLHHNDIMHCSTLSDRTDCAASSTLGKTYSRKVEL